jgi:hypothetical protein
MMVGAVIVSRDVCGMDGWNFGGKEEREGGIRRISWFPVVELQKDTQLIKCKFKRLSNWDSCLQLGRGIRNEDSTKNINHTETLFCSIARTYASTIFSVISFEILRSPALPPFTL